ncbi:hypothetical protein BD408DRAFT_410369 [Parasitella parasitica]|nr:hypothetical protein BD408DRAFT_410369 [Parasitella parasitica]
MPQWETILDESSHISPVKINPPKNHSTERLEILIKNNGTAKTCIKSAKKNKSTTLSKRLSMRIIIIPLLMLLSLIYMIVSLGCSSSKYTSNHPVCKSVNQLPSLHIPYNVDNSWFHDNQQKTKEWLVLTVESCEPYVSKIRQAYRWFATTSIKTAYKETHSFARSKIYTPQNELRSVKYITKHIRDIVDKLWVKLRLQMEEYIDSGSIASLHSNKKDSENSYVVEDKLKKTAKRILDYIDQINEESANTGMKQNEARLKAQEIIKGIADAITVDHVQMPQTISINQDSTDVDKIAVEIHKIMELASLEKKQLDEKLDLIQSKLLTLPTDNEEQDSHLLIIALKAEVDQLRATAEQNVRKKTKSSLQIVESIHAIPSIKNHMREDIQSAQRAALKDLRQVYIKLYQTNKLMDELAH